MTSILFSGCISNGAQKENTRAELVVYCENGILYPVRETAILFEKETGIRVTIQNDAARNLINQIHYLGEADVFIPDSREGILSILSATPNLITDSSFLGYQSLVFLVPRGNPGKFDGSLYTLLDPEHGLIMANPESSTLGMVTGALLKDQLIFDPVMNAVLFFTTDSRGLIPGIITNQASVAIDWKSSYISNYQAGIDTIPVYPPVKKHPALAVTLETAPHPENAEIFLKMLTSKKGNEIFKKFGIENNQYPDY